MRNAICKFVPGLSVFAVLFFAPARADATAIGEPSTFTITVKQGSQVIAQKAVDRTAGDLPDIKIDDGTPESILQLITMTASGTPTPIILKLVSQPLAGSVDDYRYLHFYIDVPLSMVDIDHPGSNSLFDPNSSDRIEVSVTNLTWTNGVLAQPLVMNDPYFYTSFMRDHDGHFYESPLTNPYDFVPGQANYSIQVPGTAYLDADTNMYTFSGSYSGAGSALTWGAIPNPGQGTTVHNKFPNGGGLTPTVPGYVFELGVSAAFLAVPEPASVGLLMIGLLLMRRRSASRRRA